jgi:hypothetical protein
MAVLAGKLTASRSDCAPVAGKSTLNRLELSKAQPTRYAKIAADTTAIENLFVDLFLDAHAAAPEEIILDLDATDDPLHGHQEGRFFHGYYDCYCYLPLYIFCGRHLLAAKLRPANIDACGGALEEAIRVVARIRTRWPRTRIILRADSGFCRDTLMAWAEGNTVDYLFGLARNKRLVAAIGAELQQARLEAEATGKPARRFKELIWRTRKSWSCKRRVVAKAEWTEGKATPRFVVTSLPVEEIEAKRLYEDVYCARGEMEIWPSWCVSRVINGGGTTYAMLAAMTQAFKRGFVCPDEPKPVGQHRHLAGDHDPTLDPAVDCIAGGLQPNSQFIDSPLPWLTRPQPGGQGQAGRDRHADTVQQIANHRRGIGRPPLRRPPSFRIQGYGDRRSFVTLRMQFADTCQQGHVVAELRQARHGSAQVMSCPHAARPVAFNDDRFALTLDGGHDALQHQSRDRLPVDGGRGRRYPESWNV